MQALLLIAAGTTATRRRPGTAMRPHPVSRLLPALLAVLLSLGLAAPARAVVTITTNTTINSPINDSVHVVGTAVVNLVAGGSINGNLSAFDSSTVTVSGGSIGGRLATLGGGTIHVFGQCLVLANGLLTGTLQSGAAIYVAASGNIVLHGADSRPPTITCPANITVSTDPNQCIARVNYPAATVSDNCPGPLNVFYVAPSGSIFGKGTTSVAVIVTDAAGNNNACHFTVTVKDTQAPTITCPANITVNAPPGQCGALVSFPPPTVTDNCLGVGAPVCRIGNQVITSPHTFPVGSTSVTCAATDGAGLTATCSFTVKVNDTQPPSITCPANITKSNDPNKCSAVVTYPTPTPSDNCNGPVTVTCSPASGSTFPVGSTSVTCTATDAAGLTANCSFTVTVNDSEKPTLTCPANITVSTDPGQCAATVSFPSPTVTDNCPGTTVVCKVGNQEITSPHTFPVGTNTVTCTATDAAGNTATCSFAVGE
jgi:hypothetical protein